MELLAHYKKLFFFLRNRFKGDNYAKMREYLTEVLLEEIEAFIPLDGSKVLDVGGAQGEFCQTLSQMRDCKAINYEPFPDDSVWSDTVVGFADAITYEDGHFDVVLCRGVLEHIPTDKQLPSIQEMYRVTRKGGICYIMIPPWYNPHAGHKLKPFHYFPFKVAKYLRHLFFSNRIKTNSYEEQGLFPITFRRMLKMTKAAGFQVAATKDTHLRLHVLTKIPLVREVAVPAVAFILRKPMN